MIKTIFLLVILSGVALASDPPFKLSSQKPDPPLKPLVVKSNLVEFEIEGVVFKIYNHGNGKISVKKIIASQIYDPEITVPSHLRREAVGIARSIFKEQENRLRFKNYSRQMELFDFKGRRWLN